MLKEIPYTSFIKDMPFMFSEMRRTAILLCEKRTVEDIVEMSLQKNIYQLEKQKRRRDVPLRMLKRLSTIDMPLIEIVANGREDEAKLIAFLALMKADQLLFEYMREVYADRYHLGQGEHQIKISLTLLNVKYKIAILLPIGQAIILFVLKTLPKARDIAYRKSLMYLLSTKPII